MPRTGPAPRSSRGHVVDPLTEEHPITDMRNDAPRSPSPAAVPRVPSPRSAGWRLPGVYPRQGDTELLLSAVHAELDARRGPVALLELGVGGGAVAVHASRRPDTAVTGVDLSRRALLTSRLQAAARGRRLRLRRGDLAAPVGGERFDVVVSNPPYVPSDDALPPRRGRARAWDAGHDGRHVLDRVTALAPSLLAPGGTLLLVQSALAGVTPTREQLAAHGLVVDEVARLVQPLGPVLRDRRDLLRRRGLLAAEQDTEEVVVIRARRPVTA